MKRQKRKTKPPATTKVGRSANAQANESRSTRPNAFVSLRNWGVLAAVVAAGAWYLVVEVTATIAEHDLSRIGNGIPAVVQIHDPRCASCVALQREARVAMEAFDTEELQYLVADINNAEGRSFAAAHGVGNVTLLLFDGEGKRRRTLAGSNTSEILAHYFRSHSDRYRAKR